MEKYKKLWEEIEVASNHEVIKKSCVSSKGLLMILIAIGCIVGAKAFEDPNSSMPTCLYTVAAILLLSGIIKICVSRTCYIFNPTKSKLYSKTLYFDAKDEIELRNSLEMKKIEGLKALTKKKDGVIKLELMLTNDGQYVALQLFEYIPYAYEAVSPVWCYYEGDAQQLAAFVKS
jgi:hypothetical protein